MTRKYVARSAARTNADLDAWITTLGQGRTVPTIPDFLVNNAVYNVADYGAKPGATSGAIKAAIQLALDKAKLTRGTVVIPPGDYDIGNISAAQQVFLLTGATDVRILAYGARIICNTTDVTQTKLFSFSNCERIFVEGLRLRDDGADQTVTWRGCIMFWLQITNANTYRDFAFIRCGSEKGVAFLVTTSYALGGGSVPVGLPWLRNIFVDHCFALNNYYGINCQDAGTNVRIRGFRAHNCIRGYFVYGVEDHDGDITCSQDAGFVGASNCIFIKHYYYNTRNIRMRLNVNGAYTCSEFVAFQQQPTSGGAAYVDDVAIEFHLDTNGTKAVAQAAVLFNSYLENGTEETVTTANRWDRISLTGSFGGIAAGATKIKFGVKQTTEGRIYLNETMYASADAHRAHFPGFVVRVAHDREFRTLRGDLTTQTLKIPLAGFDGGPLSLTVHTFATDFGAAANHTWREDAIIAHNASGGAVVIDASSVPIHIVNAGVALAAAYTPNGENIDCTFVGAPYNVANAYLRQEIQYNGSPAGPF